MISTIRKHPLSDSGRRVFLREQLDKILGDVAGKVLATVKAHRTSIDTVGERALWT